MKGIAITFFSLATAATTVLAGSKISSSRPADPEGQYPRLGACPDPHACIFPPDVSTFLPGAYFDLRVELHAYDKDTSKPTPAPYTEFKTVIRKDRGNWVDINKFFKTSQPEIENWTFNWVDSIETQFSEYLNNTNKPVEVAVASRAWRKLKITTPGDYEVQVQYGPNKSSYTAKYTIVEPKKPKKKAKNVILFISDGTNVGMVTAARAIARKHTSGKFEKLLTFEDFDQLGHVITNSIDSLITDSANSASSFATGHKASVNCLGVYADSSKDPFDDPKVELLTELIRRRQPKKAIGIVSTAYGQDATPSAFTSHTRLRSTSAEITDQILHGVGNWTDAVMPDVWLAGGAEYFTGPKALNQENYYDAFKKSGYNVVMDKKSLLANKKDDKLLGVFRTGNLDVWFERNLFVNNTVGNKAHPSLNGKDALGSDQPGLSDMTLSALEVLKKRGGKDGFFLMSEAASVDKKLHTFDFARAYAELIELDVTIKNTIAWLKKNGQYEDTLILLTADHSHSFDIYGSVDSNYMMSHDDENDMRNSIGVYEQAGWPGYFDNNGDGFPDNWFPKVVLAAGTANSPDRHEAFQTTTDGPRLPTVAGKDGIFISNPKDSAGKYGHGLHYESNLPIPEKQGTHSMSDVFMYANGPSSDLFKKTYENWEVFFKIAEALDIQRPSKHE